MIDRKAMNRARREREKAERKRVREHERNLRKAEIAEGKKAKSPPINEPHWYREYLKTDHWKQFKVDWRKANRGRRRCEICGDRRYELHHRTYERIGEERFDDIVPLCRGHHARAHKREREGVPLFTAHLEE